jgi:4-hydroxybenzoyl-CoA reductase subunit beta
MLLPPHEFAKPASLTESLELLRAAHASAPAPAYTDQVKLLGGGTDVVYNMRGRLFTPGLVVSLKDIPELIGVSELADGSLRIGGATRLTDLVDHPAGAGRYPALATAFRAVASRHVRNMATLAGNLCLDTRCWYTNQTESWRATKGPCLKTGKAVCHVIRSAETCVAVNNADSPPALIALDAAVTLTRAGGERTLPLKDFYRNDGVWHTVREPDEILTAVTFPPTTDRLVFIKNTARQGMDFAYGTIAARADGQGDRASRAAIVIGSLTTAPLVLRAAPGIIARDGLGDGAIDAICATLKDEMGPLTNLYSPAAYKRELARGLVRQALEALREGRTS